MTDKEIEKAARFCLSAESCFSCDICAYAAHSKENQTMVTCHALLEDALDYINRLKAENEKLKAIDNRVAFSNAYDHLQADYKRVVEELHQTRKNTAKDVLAKCLNLCHEQGGVCYDVDIQRLAADYGVEEVDE